MPTLRRLRTDLGRFGAQLRARVGKQDIVRVAVRVACVVLGLELAYAGVANVLLSSNAVVAMVQGGDGVKLDYASAYSIVPGHVHVRRLRLRFEDYNVQFQVAIERATVDISIDELFKRKFHALSVLADGVSFRMRYKSHEVGNNGPRFAAYPKIEGFADPPLYHGVDPPATPDAEYDLWGVRIENVVAHVSELWAQEYRFAGDAEARGSFSVQPERYVQVEPAMLRIRSGALTVGQAPVARRMTGRIHYSMPNMDIPTTFGIQAFHYMSTRLQLELSDGDLSFLNVYGGSEQPTLSGPVSSTIDANVVRGVIQQGSELRAHSPALQVSWPKLSLASELSLHLGRFSADPQLDVETQLNAVRLSSRLTQRDGPTARQLTSSVTLVGVDLSQPIEPAAAHVATEARLANLAWLDAFFSSEDQPHFSGSGSLLVELTRARAGGGDGELELSVQRGRVQTKAYAIYSDVHAVARFYVKETPDLFAQGAVSFRASNGDSLLSLAVGSVARKLLSAGLSLGVLNANVAFHVAPSGLDLQLTQATCGAVSGRGYFRQPAHGAGLGAALVSAGPFNVGLAVQHAHTQTSLLVGSGWLEDTWRRLRGLPPEG